MTSVMPRNSWMLPSSDEEDDDDTFEQVALLPAAPLHFSRHRWMRRIMHGLEEYFVCLVMPALCLFAVYALTKDHYASETFMLSTNSSLLLQPSPFLVNAVEVQAFGEKQGPELYGFNGAPQLESEASWSESHNVVVAPYQVEAFSLWLNKGSLLNVTCAVKQEGYHNVIIRVLKERKSTSDWIEDTKQRLELDCNEDGTCQYVIMTDGNYSLVIENLETHHVQVFLGFEVVATLYSTNSAVYLCIPFPKACQLQISFFGHKAAVLSTPNYSQSNPWKAKLSYKVRWFALAGALGCLFFLSSALLKVASQLHIRRFYMTEDGDGGEKSDESAWGDFEEISEEDGCKANAFCVVCLDAFKDSFFIPCGHSTTCLPCGQRLKNERGGCPSCKLPIEMVNQMFHV